MSLNVLFLWGEKRFYFLSDGSNQAKEVGEVAAFYSLQ
jgi:hypothetical protein